MALSEAQRKVLETACTNPIDAGAFKVGNCIGSSEDGFDRTYRYYYYRAVA